MYSLSTILQLYIVYSYQIYWLYHNSQVLLMFWVNFKPPQNFEHPVSFKVSLYGDADSLNILVEV